MALVGYLFFSSKYKSLPLHPLLYSSTSSTRAVKSRFTGAADEVDAGSAEVVVADGAASVVGADSEALDFLLDFLLFLVCK